MKKALLLSIIAMLVLAGGAFAVDPVFQWENKCQDTEFSTKGMDVIATYVNEPTPSLNIGNPIIRDKVWFASAMRRVNANDGVLISEDTKEIGENHTVIKGACIGQNGDIITAGYWFNGTNSVFWTAGYSPEPHGWL